MEGLFHILPESAKQACKGLCAEQLSQTYNQNLLFAPGRYYKYVRQVNIKIKMLSFSFTDDSRLCYSIREQICVGVWPSPKEFEAKSFVKNLFVKSRCIDASTCSFAFFNQHNLSIHKNV